MRTCKHNRNVALVAETPYTHCVAGDNCCPASHGGVTMKYRCLDCQATRLYNINQKHVEKSGWESPEETHVHQQ